MVPTVFPLSLPGGATQNSESWFKLYGPIIGAVIGASVTVYFNYYLKGRADKRRICRNTAAILRVYLEELTNGRDFMECLMSEIRQNQTPGSTSPLPKASWGNFSLDADGLSQLMLLPDQFGGDKEQPLHTLPSHLKNCFDHIATNYDRVLAEMYPFALLKQAGQPQGWERNVKEFEAKIKGGLRTFVWVNLMQFCS